MTTLQGFILQEGREDYQGMRLHEYDPVLQLSIGLLIAARGHDGGSCCQTLLRTRRQSSLLSERQQRPRPRYCGHCHDLRRDLNSTTDSVHLRNPLAMLPCIYDRPSSTGSAGSSRHACYGVHSGRESCSAFSIEIEWVPHALQELDRESGKPLTW